MRTTSRSISFKQLGKSKSRRVGALLAGGALAIVPVSAHADEAANAGTLTASGAALMLEQAVPAVLAPTSDQTIDGANQTEIRE